MLSNQWIKVDDDNDFYHLNITSVAGLSFRADVVKRDAGLGYPWFASVFVNNDRFPIAGNSTLLNKSEGMEWAENTIKRYTTSLAEAVKEVLNT